MQFGNNINKFFFIKDEANRRKRCRKDASSEEDMQDMQNLTSIEGMKSQDILDTALSLKGHLMDRSDLEVQDCRWRTSAKKHGSFSGCFHKKICERR